MRKKKKLFEFVYRTSLEAYIESRPGPGPPLEGRDVEIIDNDSLEMIKSLLNGCHGCLADLDILGRHLLQEHPSL